MRRQLRSPRAHASFHSLLRIRYEKTTEPSRPHLRLRNLLGFTPGKGGVAKKFPSFLFPIWTTGAILGRGGGIGDMLRTSTDGLFLPHAFGFLAAKFHSISTDTMDDNDI